MGDSYRSSGNFQSESISSLGDFPFSGKVDGVPVVNDCVRGNWAFCCLSRFQGRDHDSQPTIFGEPFVERAVDSGRGGWSCPSKIWPESGDVDATQDSDAVDPCPGGCRGDGDLVAG